MSSIIRCKNGSTPLTVIETNKGEIVELRNGNATFSIGKGRRGPNKTTWLQEMGLNEDLLKIVSGPKLRTDAKFLIEFLHKHGRAVNMLRLKSGAYKYNPKTYLFVRDGDSLVPFFVAADGAMQYKYERGNEFSDFDLVCPEFWVMDTGNHIVKYDLERE
jgi:hypothetical protein